MLVEPSGRVTIRGACSGPPAVLADLHRIAARFQRHRAQAADRRRRDGEDEDAGGEGGGVGYGAVQVRPIDFWAGKINFWAYFWPI